MSGADWRDVLGLAAILGGSFALVAVCLGLWWVSRQPREHRHFMRRRAATDRRHFQATRQEAHWYVRSGFDRRHGAGRRQGH